DCPAAYSFVRTYTATDACGNSSSTSHTIYVDDTTAPVWDAYDVDVDMPCDDVDDVILVSATDNCSDFEITYEDETVSGGCAGNIIRTYFVSDACGNEAESIQQIIHLLDNTSPWFVEFPMDVTVECSDDTPSADDQMITYEDNCTAVTLSYDGFEVVPGVCENSYQLVHCWTITDNCGNETDACWTVTVQDTTAPVVVSADDVTIECDMDLPAPSHTVTDNCDLNPIVVVTSVIADGDCPQEYVMTRTYTATDACGNVSTDMQVITVQDTTSPLIDDVADMNYECNTDIPVMLPNATDNCELADVTYDDGVEMPGDCPAAYSFVRTYTATDACGNSSSTSHTIYVDDTTAPVWDAYEVDVDMPCDDVDDAILVSATDNCSDFEITYEDETVSGGCAGNIIRTYSIVDACGNAADPVQQIIHLLDNVNPWFVDFPMDVTVPCDDVPTSDVLITFDDNCTAVTLAYDGLTSTPGDCIGNYTNVHCWTITDNCGNSVQACWTITVIDEDGPEFEFIPSGDDISCESVVPVEMAEAFDICGTAVVTYTDAFVEGDCPQSYEVVRTWTATDDCGNATIADQTTTYNVYDNVPPVIADFIADISVDCPDDVPSFDDWAATDNCDPNPVVSTDINVMAEDSCGNYFAEVTCTATDACGNSSSVSFTITVQDNIAPVLDDEPADLVLDCEAEAPAADDCTATDNCGNEVEISYNEQMFGDLPAEGSIVDCQLVQPVSPYYNPDWALWLQDFPMGYEFYSLMDGNWVEYPDGSAHITATVVSTDNASAGWSVDVWFTNGVDWDAWSTQGFPTSFKDDFNIAGLNYLEWNYFLINADSSALTGWGDFAGSMLNLSHAPSNYFYGYQVGVAANNVNGNYGSGGWFYYNGLFVDSSNQFQSEVDGAGDFAFEHDCCPQYWLERTWCATDCSGNESCHTQTITFEDLGGIGSPEGEFPLADVVEAKDNFEIIVVAPNPTAENATIKFASPTVNTLKLEIYDLAGRKVGVLFNGNVVANQLYTVDFSAGDLESGIYTIRLASQTRQVNEKLVVSK
ncbi:MAG: hypothetical protein ACJAV7_002203, partial [Flavobacteriales bacterium]